MENLVLLLNNKIDGSKFEEKCVELFGNKSYSLYSAPILLDHAIEYIKIITSEITTNISRKMIDQYLKVCHYILPLYLTIISCY
jgi:hypothetical protein